jgi:hypothetical protein
LRFDLLIFGQPNWLSLGSVRFWLRTSKPLKINDSGATRRDRTGDLLITNRDATKNQQLSGIETDCDTALPVEESKAVNDDDPEDCGNRS